jgi:hypothetical protein
MTKATYQDDVNTATRSRGHVALATSPWSRCLGHVAWVMSSWSRRSPWARRFVLLCDLRLMETRFIASRKSLSRRARREGHLFEANRHRRGGLQRPLMVSCSTLPPLMVSHSPIHPYSKRGRRSERAKERTLGNEGIRDQAIRRSRGREIDKLRDFDNRHNDR